VIWHFGLAHLVGPAEGKKKITFGEQKRACVEAVKLPSA